MSSSRDSLAEAGWRCEATGSYRDLLAPREPRFSWLHPSVLWQSRNHVLAHQLGDPTDELRRRWVRAQRERGADPGRVLERGGDAVSFLVIGDPGEGDASQFATVPPLLAVAGGTDFMVICSDVVYPAGGVEQYEDKFYWPYKDYPAPIYGVPGNHDWYDGLTGFMLHFCHVEDVPKGSVRVPGVPAWRDLLRRALWRPPERALSRAALARGRTLRGDPGQEPPAALRQPGPYFAMDAGPLRIVAIDTGIEDRIDRDQAAWLERVSAESPRPKILLTGRPFYADGEHWPGWIEGEPGRPDPERTIDQIVRASGHNYVAVIGGDTHNYQRYPVRLDDGRTIQYVVSGAGGAFTGATHTLGRVELPGVREDDFRCYPLRGDSLSLFSRMYDRRIAGGRGLLEIPPDEAAALVAERIGVTPTRPDARRTAVTARARLAARIVYPLPSERGFRNYMSEFFDWNHPPMFKSFLRLDARPDELVLRCFAATGCLEHEADPPLEDEVRIPLASA